MGHFYASIKIAILKHKGSTQHETLLVVSPGSLHMNTSIDNIHSPDVSIPKYVLAAMTAARKQTTAKVSCSKTFFLVNSVYTNNVVNACVHV